jgi:alkylmercury lyase
MLGQPAEVQSICPVTSTDVRVTVDPDSIRSFDPKPLWVSFPPAATASTAADMIGTFCCHVHFLATPAAAEQWLSQHPDGTVLDLDGAHELGRNASHCCTG